MPGIYIEGGRELLEKLQELDLKVTRKIASKALRAGAKVVLAKTKSIVPKRTGLLKSTLTVRTGKSRRGSLSFLVQTRAGDYKGETFYGSFLEFGHLLGSRKLANRKRIPAKRFMRDAFDITKGQAVGVITGMIRQGILDAI